MSRRSEQLRDAVREFNAVHDRWTEDENRPNPDASYWDAVDRLGEVFDAGDIPADCKDLYAAADEFFNEVAEFDDREDVGRNYPHDGFWEARRKLEDTLTGADYADLPPLESIADLEKQKVPHGQIAKIWGFIDRRGEPMPVLVQRELDKPGSVIKAKGSIDGRDWRDPRLPEEATTQPAEARKKKSAAKTKAAKGDPCKETPFELWEQQVAVSQAAKMLQLPESEVEELFFEFMEAKESEAAKQTAGA